MSMNRVNRREFWAKILLTSGLSAALLFGIKCLGEGVLAHSALQALCLGWGAVQLVIFFGVSIPLTIKRLHDVGLSGWWLLGWFILDNVVRNLSRSVALESVALEVKDWISILLLVLLAFWPGDRDENAYGPPAELPASGLVRCGLVVRNRFRVKLIAIAVALLALFVGLMLAFGPRQEPVPEPPRVSDLFALAQKPDAEFRKAMDELTVMGSDYASFRAQFRGQRIAFTNVTQFSFWRLGNDWTEVYFNRPDAGLDADHRLNVLAFVETAKIDALAHDSVKGDRLGWISGRVATVADLAEVGRGVKDFQPYCGNAIVMVVDDFEASWKDEKLPDVDVAKLSGDDWARFALSLDERKRMDMLQRLLKRIDGRELAFSACRVGKSDLSHRPFVDIAVLDPDSRKEAFAFTVPVSDKAMANWVRRLPSGTELKSVRATVCKKTDYDYARGLKTQCVWMDKFSFGESAEVPALPQFDAKTITGDGLLTVLRTSGRKLSLDEVKNLEKRLSGRRLKFASEFVRGYHHAENGVLGVEVEAEDLGLSFLVMLKDSVSESSVDRKRGIEGSVVAPSFWSKDADADRPIVHLDQGRLD